MDWIMIAVVAGSILVSGHASEEACRGRAAMVEKDQKVAVTCVKAPSHSSGITPGGGTGLQWECSGAVCTPR